MGLIAVVLSFTRRFVDGGHVADVKGDPGGGAVVTPRHFADPGDDSQPLPEDFMALTDAPGSGRTQAVGYWDPKNEGKSAPGEKRLYSRNAAGEPTAEIWLKSDGDIVVKCLAPGRTLTIESNGPVEVKSAEVVRLGKGAGGRQVACVGDLVAGALHALSAAPGNPILPAAGPPTPSGGVSFVAQIISGREGVTASD